MLLPVTCDTCLRLSRSCTRSDPHHTSGWSQHALWGRPAIIWCVVHSWHLLGAVMPCRAPWCDLLECCNVVRRTAGMANLYACHAPTTDLAMVLLTFAVHTVVLSYRHHHHPGHVPGAAQDRQRQWVVTGTTCVLKACLHAHSAPDH